MKIRHHFWSKNFCVDFTAFTSTPEREKTDFGPKYPFPLQLDWTIPKSGKFGRKTPHNSHFSCFSSPDPQVNFLKFPKRFLMGLPAIPALILPKWQKVQISAFLDGFQENMPRSPTMPLRNLRDVSSDQHWAAFSEHNT